MKRCVLFILLFAVYFTVGAQVRLIYEDNSGNKDDLGAVDLIENDVGDIVYIGKHKFDDVDSEVGHFYRGYVTVISKHGELIRSFFDDEDCDYSRYESINLTDDGTYIVCGGKSVDSVSYTTITEFDKNLNILWSKRYKIGDGCRSVYRHRTRDVRNGTYYGIFNYFPPDCPDVYDCMLSYIIRFTRDGDLIDMIVDPTNNSVYYHGPSDVIPIVESEDFLIISAFYAYRYDKDLNVIDTTRMRTIDDYGRFYWEVAGRRLTDGRIVVGGVDYKLDNGSTYSIIIGELADEGFSKYVKILPPPCKNEYFWDCRGFPIDKKALDFVTEDNIIVGATLNGHCASFGRPFFPVPSAIGLVSFDSDFNVNWQEYYSDDYSYYVMAMCATKDGGAVITAIKSKYNYDDDYGEQYGKVAIFKVRGDVISIDDVDADGSVLRMYPNPAVGRVEVELLEITVDRDLKLEFYDMTGRLLKTERIYGGTQSVCVSDLKRGVYNVRLVAGETALERTKIVLR